MKDIDSICSKTASLNVSTFDLVFMRHALEHSADPVRLLLNVSLYLKPNGRLFIEVPLFSSSKEESFLEQFWEEHLFYFSVKSLNSILLLANLNVETCQIVQTENEPVISVVVSKTSKVFHQKHKVEFDPISLDVWASLEIKKARAFLSDIGKSREIVFVGANHKSINFIDIVASPTNKLFLLDGESRKIGKFSTKYSLEILPLEELLRFKTAKLFTTVNPKRFKDLFFKDKTLYEQFSNVQNIYSVIRDL